VVQTVVGLLLLLILGFAGYHRPFDRPGWPVGLRFFFFSGTAFIFIGLALGERFIGLLDQATIGQLTPLFSLGLGYFGLIFGLQFEVEKIRRFPGQFLRSTAVEALAAFLLVFAVFFCLLAVFERLSTAATAALVVGAVACCSSPSLAALMLSEKKPPRGRVEIDLIRYISGFDAIIGFTLFGIAACLTSAGPSLSGAPIPAALQWMALSLGFGAGMGLLLHLLTQVHCAENELWVFTIGSIVFTGGVALYFGLSPLFVNMVAGFAAANLPGSKDRIFMAIFRQEKPVYLIFLILAGAVWEPAMGLSLILALVYVTARTTGKLLGGWLAARYAAWPLEVSAGIGRGLISQSGVAVAMTMDLYLSGCLLGEILVAMLISAFILNELISPAMARPFLWGRKAGGP
jgi:hypothetical protein